MKIEEIQMHLIIRLKMKLILINFLPHTILIKLFLLSVLCLSLNVNNFIIGKLTLECCQIIISSHYLLDYK